MVTLLQKRRQKIVAKELRMNNAMEMDIILHGLFDPVKDKIEKCTSTKEL